MSSEQRGSASGPGTVEADLSAGTCTVHGCRHTVLRKVGTVASWITVARTLAVLAIVIVAYVSGARSGWPYVVALIVHWVGDSADGNYARLTKTETVFGAYFDVVCDRIGLLAIVLGMFSVGWLEPRWLTIWYVAYFAGVDFALSLIATRAPLISTNYYKLVDTILYRLNWSIPAKTTNSTVILILIMVGVPVWIPVILLGGWTLVKLGSLPGVIGHAREHADCVREFPAGRAASAAADAAEAAVRAA